MLKGCVIKVLRLVLLIELKPIILHWFLENKLIIKLNTIEFYFVLANNYISMYGRSKERLVVIYFYFWHKKIIINRWTSGIKQLVY